MCIRYAKFRKFLFLSRIHILRGQVGVSAEFDDDIRVDHSSQKTYGKSHGSAEETEAAPFAGEMSLFWLHKPTNEHILAYQIS